MSEEFMKMMPCDINAESCVISAMMIEDTAIARAIEILKDNHFYKTEHRILFQTMVDMFHKGIVVDIITLIHELETLSLIKQAGGPVFINEISDAVLSYANIEMHANIVFEKAMLRHLIVASTMIIETCYEPEGEARNIVDWAEQKIFEITDQPNKKSFLSYKDAIPPTQKHLTDVANARFSDVSTQTGFSILDKKLCGLFKGQLIILAARPGMGKSAFAVNLAYNVARHNKKVGVFTLEMSTEEIMLRLLSSVTFLSMDTLHKGKFMTPEKFETAMYGLEQMKDYPIHIDDNGGNTLLEIKAKSRRLKAELKGLDLIIIDYLQIIPTRKRTENRNQELSEMTRNLKLLAKDLNVPVVCLSQINRAVESRDDKRPRLSDLRDSGAIEQDADVVMFIYREGYYKKQADQQDTEIIIAKNRHGETGTINLNFYGEYTKFENKPYC